MQNRDGVQKGPQDHAEGQHGAKTRSKILEQMQKNVLRQFFGHRLIPQKMPGNAEHHRLMLAYQLRKSPLISQGGAFQRSYRLIHSNKHRHS